MFSEILNFTVSLKDPSGYAVCHAVRRCKWLSDCIFISNQSIKQYNRTLWKVMTKYKGFLRSEIKGSEGVSEGAFY